MLSALRKLSPEQRARLALTLFLMSAAAGLIALGMTQPPKMAQVIR